jgi:lambda family phage portal protein
MLQALAEKTGAPLETEERFKEEIEWAFSLWAKNCGRDGKSSFWQICRTVDKALACDGEAFVILGMNPKQRRIPMVLEVIDSDRVETPPEEVSNIHCRLGIQYNPQTGVIEGYHVRKASPHREQFPTIEYDFIPADRMLHVFDGFFAEQERGLPWMHRVTKRAKDLGQLDEAGLVGAQTEAMFAGFVVKPSDSRGSSAKTSATKQEADGKLTQEIQPGRLQYLGPDEEVRFGSPTKSNSVGTLQEHAVRRMAAGLNHPYEMLARDWRGTSFAGGRLILHGFKMSTRARQQLLRERFLEPVYQAAVRWAVVFGHVSLANELYKTNPDRWHMHSWTAPAFGYALNPGEEVEAAIKRMGADLTTHADEIAELGGDLEARWKQKATELAYRKELGLDPLQLVPQGGAPNPSVNQPAKEPA